MNPGYEDTIISALKRSDVPAIHSSELADMLQIPAEDRAEFDAAVDHLASSGRLMVGSGRLLSLPAMGNRVVGRFRQTSRGFGFIIPDEPNAHGDLFIPAGENMDAVTGDIVVAKVIVREKYDTRDRKNTFGRIVEILKRATNRVVGTLQRERNRWFVIPDGTVFRGQVLVADVTAKSAKENDKVVVELMKFPRDDQPAEGVILEVLGERGEPEVELQSVLRQFELPAEFPAAVMDQAAEAARSYDPEKIIERADRQDLSDETIITIDPDDARDFDDAISLRVLRNQRTRSDDAGEPGPEMDSLLAGEPVYELGVHIADVSHFVPVESPMDIEARTRGNSTYFPRYVIPMLPEILSNGVCSLQEGVYRLTKSAFIRYDAYGNVVSTRFANTVIKSAKRLTYTQAQAIIDDAKGEGKPYSKGLLESPPNPNVPDVAAPVRTLLVNMDRLARAIRQRRLEAGMMVLDLPEVELVMDDEGHVIDARPEDDAFTHKIIEMFMVEANEAVARWLTRNDVPVLRRVHPEPDAITAEQVRQFLMVAGRKVPKVLDRKAVQSLLSSVKGTPVSYAVNLAVLKTFTTAEYSPVAVGHYALASDNYAHFTSPIRRYADLVIHRAFNAVVNKKGKIKVGGKSRAKAEDKSGIVSGVPGKDRGTALMPDKLGDVPDFQTLTNLGKYLSFTERRSSDAERELRAVKVLQLLAEHTGDVIDGVVTGVTNFGVFVQSTRFLTEGMIRTADLPDDFWQFDERTGVLRGQRTGRRIAMGDRARVQIVAVNIPARQLDLRLLEHGSGISGDTALRQMQPRHEPKPHKAHDGETIETDSGTIRHVGRKKNLAKREQRKLQQRLAKQQKKNTGPGRRGRRRGRR